MLQAVNTGHKSLADYASLVSRSLMEEIRRLAAPLRGKRVLHLSATAFGGGVAEINYTLVPLMADVGLEVEWRIIHGAEEFFNVTKTIHNALQARELEDGYDLVIVHDPQPVGLIEHFESSRARWIWRCHIDLSAPNH